MSKKVTDLREAVSFEGLVALGVDTTKNESVQVPLQFVKQGADAAIAAAQSATTATQAAATATSNANTATQAALDAATAANTAAELANIEALATAAQNAATNANTATVNADTATKAANAAVSTIDTKIATKLNIPTANIASAAAIRNLVGQTSTGASTKVSPLQLRELVGIDHSLLTEQEVLGEFWLDQYGNKKQVFVRCFKGTTPGAVISGTKHYILPPALASSVETAVLVYFSLRSVTSSLTTYNEGLYLVKLQSESYRNLGIIIGPFDTKDEADQFANKPYAFAIKYIK